MASPEFRLTVVLSPAAVNELADIWRWNAERYSPSHADDYVAFLKNAIYRLDSFHDQGTVVSIRPNLRYILIRRRANGHGHVAVYSFDTVHVNVLHVFHTAQNWQSILAQERPSP
jgi:plasmid stabilization system protein ParE